MPTHTAALPFHRLRAPRWAPTALLAASLVAALSGCGPTNPSAATSASASPPPATAPAAPVASTAPPELTLNCDIASLSQAGTYLAENNSWGRQGVVGWSQCMGAAMNAKGGLSARWTWDWKYEGDNVKAYPEVVFGHKPGFPTSSTPLLPRKLGALQQLVVDYDVHTEREGAGNLAIDMWLTSTANPTTFAVPPITHEVMIWLEVYGPMFAGGQQVDKVRINGTLYRVYVGEKFGLGWRYVAFAPNSPMKTSASVDLMPFFEYLKGKNLITVEEHLAAVNLGNEIISGSGDTRLNHFAVTVR